MKAEKHLPLAVLTAQLSRNPDGWQQLLPKGEFRARDGRPTDAPFWFLDQAGAVRLIEQAKALKQDLLIDYDHATLLKAKHGIDEGDVVAAGWFGADDIRWFDDNERQGLYIKPRWTEKAYRQIKAGEFAFLSAVFPYNERGEVLEIRMAAVTNDPGITGMQRLAVLSALTQQPENRQMSEILRQLLAKLGVETAEGTEPDDTQWKAALAAVETLQNEKQQATEQVAALNAAAATVDLSAYVPKTAYDAMVERVAVLSAKTDETEIERLIGSARNEGRVLAAEEDYLKGFGKQQGVAALSAMLSQRPQIAALSAVQSVTVTPEKSAAGTAVLSAVAKV